MLPTQAPFMPAARVPGEENRSPFSDREPAQEAHNMQIVVNLGRLGQDQGGKQSPVPPTPSMPGKVSPCSQHTPPPPVSTVTFWAPFPGRGSSLRTYLIVDRPVPGLGSKFIVLGFEAIVPLQESGKEKLVKTEIERTHRNARHRDP